MKKNIINKSIRAGVIFSAITLAPLSVYADTGKDKFLTQAAEDYITGEPSVVEVYNSDESAEEVQVKDPHLVTVSNWTVTGDLVVPKGYTKVKLVNTTVLGTIIFEENLETNTVYIDEKSKVSLMDINSQLTIENDGTLEEVVANKPANISGKGTIKELLVKAPGVIDNNVDICFDFSEGQAFTKQPATYYKGHVKVSSQLSNQLVNIAGNIFRINQNSEYVDSFETINGVPSIYIDGVKQIGSIKFNGDEYYSDPNGKILVGWQNVNGVKTFFESSGKRFTGSTGDAEFDAELDALLAEIIKGKTTEDEKLKAVYVWTNKNLKWRSIVVEPNKGVFPQKQVNELGKYMLDNRRGSCEHNAAIYSLLMNRMGYPTKVIGGYGLASGAEHTWIKANIDGNYYTFDPQYEATYDKKSPFSNFKMTDEVARKSHSWEE